MTASVRIISIVCLGWIVLASAGPLAGSESDVIRDFMKNGMLARGLETNYHSKNAVHQQRADIAVHPSADVQQVNSKSE